MRKIIKNNYKIIIVFVLGICASATTVYAVDAYIESKKVSYDNHNKEITTKENVQDAIDELYERSGIHKEKWVDPILNGADPILKDPLIPVEINSNGDVYYANLNSEWYNYSEKKWANAIILTDTAKEYKDDKKYKVGDHILEDDIESYFVWIPKYKYKIWNMGNYTSAISYTSLTNKAQNTADDALWKLASTNARIIEIEFGLTDTQNITTECKTTNISGDNGSCEVRKWMTHPAFTLGGKNLNGIWVGKFETGYKGADSPENALVNQEDSSKVVIKPDIYSWRGINVKNIFMTSYNYKNIANAHNVDLDPHMMKNTEWGAVAYLSHSKYGISNKININNASDYKTGYGVAAGVDLTSSNEKYANSTDSSITKPWNKEEGYLASTTGNISGVYDMCGGAQEYVAASIDSLPGSSEFDNTNLNKYMQEGYIDKYNNSSSDSSYNKRILGDAIGEMGPFYQYYNNSIWSVQHGSWYSEVVRVNYTNTPWLVRGGNMSSGFTASQFHSDYSVGGTSNIFGFRLVLSPTN